MFNLVLWKEYIPLHIRQAVDTTWGHGNQAVDLILPTLWQIKCHSIYTCMACLLFDESSKYSRYTSFLFTASMKFIVNSWLTGMIMVYNICSTYFIFEPALALGFLNCWLYGIFMYVRKYKQINKTTIYHMNIISTSAPSK